MVSAPISSRKQRQMMADGIRRVAFSRGIFLIMASSMGDRLMIFR